MIVEQVTYHTKDCFLEAVGKWPTTQRIGFERHCGKWPITQRIGFEWLWRKQQRTGCGETDLSHKGLVLSGCRENNPSHKGLVLSSCGENGWSHKGLVLRGRGGINDPSHKGLALRGWAKMTHHMKDWLWEAEENNPSHKGMVLIGCGENNTVETALSWCSTAYKRAV